MRLLRDPVVQFLAVGSLTVVAILVATGVLASRAASAEAIDDSVATTEVLARSVAEPAVPRGMVAGKAGALDRFDRTVLRRLLVGEVKRIKIWSEDGQIVYSDRTELIGATYDLGEDELAVLGGSDTEAEVSDLTRPENRFERGIGGGLVEVYTQIHSPEGEPLLFEAYYSAADIEARRKQIFDSFRWITVGALVLLLVVATPMLWVLTRRLTRNAAEREALLRRTADASEAERRRIARDLHDGVVQDLAGTAFAVSALARDTGTEPAARETLEAAGKSLRGSLRSLRSLLVELYPPELHAENLDTSLEDLVAPAASAGLHASVRVDGVAGASDASVALLWRVAQEAVRNAIRHSRAEVLTVTVEGLDDQLVLRVVDDGAGFRPDEVGQTHFGLRGLASLVEDAGGRLEVRSLPGQGTSVELVVGR